MKRAAGLCMILVLVAACAGFVGIHEGFVAVAVGFGGALITTLWVCFAIKLIKGGKS